MTEKQPPSYPLRMPQELRERLTEAAKANNRSMNAEIVARLEGSFANKEVDRYSTEIHASVDLVRKELERGAGLSRSLLMVKDLTFQEKMARRRVEAARGPVMRLQALLEKANQKDDASDANRLEHELHEEQKWLREVELEHKLLLEDLAEAKRELADAQAGQEAKAAPKKI